MRIFCELLEPAEMQLNALFYLKSLTSLIDETLGTQVPLMQRLISCKDIPVVAFKAPALLLLGHPLATLVIKCNCLSHSLAFSSVTLVLAYL